MEGSSKRNQREFTRSEGTAMMHPLAHVKAAFSAVFSSVIPAHSRLWRQTRCCTVSSMERGSLSSFFSKVKYPRSSAQAALTARSAMSIPAAADERRVGSTSRFSTDMNGLTTNICCSCVDRGVLVVKHRESAIPPGLIATAVISLKSELLKQTVSVAFAHSRGYTYLLKVPVERIHPSREDELGAAVSLKAAAGLVTVRRRMIELIHILWNLG